MKKMTTILVLMSITSTVFAADPRPNGCSGIAYEATEAIAKLNGATSVMPTYRNMVVPQQVENGFKYTYQLSSFDTEGKLMKDGSLITQVLLNSDGVCKILSVSGN